MIESDNHKEVIEFSPPSTPQIRIETETIVSPNDVVANDLTTEPLVLQSNNFNPTAYPQTSQKLFNTSDTGNTIINDIPQQQHIDLETNNGHSSIERITQTYFKQPEEAQLGTLKWYHQPKWFTLFVKLYLIAESCFDVAVAVDGEAREDQIYSKLTLSSAMLACIALVLIGASTGAPEAMLRNVTNNKSHQQNENPVSFMRVIAANSESACTDLADILLVSRVMLPIVEHEEKCLPMTAADYGLVVLLVVGPMITMILQTMAIGFGWFCTAFNLRMKLRGQTIVGQGIIPIVFALVIQENIHASFKYMLIGVGIATALLWRITTVGSMSNRFHSNEKIAPIFTLAVGCSGTILLLLGTIFPLVVAFIDISTEDGTVCHQKGAFLGYALYNAGPLPCFALFYYILRSVLGKSKWEERYGDYSKYINHIRETKGIF